MDRLRARARAELGGDPVRERVRYALRYRGQSFELAVDAPPDADPQALRVLFESAHERAYGYSEPGNEVELVTVTVSVWGAAPVIAARSASAGAQRSRTRIWHEGVELDATLLAGEPAPGEHVEAPAICALGDATLLITPGWSAGVLQDGTIELTRT